MRITPFHRRAPGRLLAAAIALTAAASVARADFVSRVYRDADGAHRYAVFIPKNYKLDRAWPVVLFLHGAGERGTDGLRPTTVGLGPVIRRDPQAFPFIAVFPQCENLRGRLLTCWNADTPDGKRALRILKDVEARYRVDPKRRVLTGWSMGGYGVWSLAAATPKLWSAVVPLSGGGDVSRAKALRKIPIWAFHGEQDGMVLPSETRGMADAVRSAGGTAQFTLVKGIGHDVWKAAYSYPPLLDWLRDPSGRSPRPAEFVATARQKAIPRNDELVPFVPAVEISRAVTVRVANDVLEAVSYSIPGMVDEKLLSGKIADIRDTTFTDGHTFNLEFLGLTYTAELASAEVRAVRGNRLRLRFGLRNVTLRMTKTHVIGTRRWAATGPMLITIGNKRPVWLTMELQPHVEKRSLKFRTLAKSFQITDDNWQVTPPKSLEVHGLGMTKKKVSDGLVKGVKTQKDRIEKEVLALVPKIVGEIEKKLAVPDSMKPIAGLWPLPVYQPRLRIWPESAAADARGLTVTFGLTAAAIDPSQAPKQPRRVTGSPSPTSPSPSSPSSSSSTAKESGLRVGISDDILPALTQLLIDADVARLHVSDIPSSPFKELIDPAVMTTILPDLKRFGPKLRVSSELQFRKPLRVATQQSGGPAFEIPDGVIAVSIRSEADADWKPYAEFAIRLSHPLKIDVSKPAFTQRAAEIQWRTDPTITVQGRYVNGVEPTESKIDAARVREIFAKGWKQWSSSFSRSKPSVPDVVFGATSLRLQGLRWESNRLVAAFSVPGIKLSNETETSLTYEVKGPRSTWGGPYTLGPGQSHEFAVPYAMVFRRRVGSDTQTLTLPAGSHSAFRRPVPGRPAALFLAR